MRYVSLLHFVYTNTHMLMQHTSGCTAMHCTMCDSHFCMWCRSIMVSTKQRKAMDLLHDHIFSCGKRPPPEEICTQAVLFPQNHDDKDFIGCWLMAHKLSILAQSVRASWTSAECKRLVLDSTFQTFLVHLKERQTHYRQKYPEKRLLKFCFQKTIGATEGARFVYTTN